ncbi:homeobox protein CDX-1 [Callorhinus ursinus]|uniref:Homeobox protein CDX-1 n=2 Tax=Otariidae TaxID=9702 RepID=A0A3Q7NLE7_CALUR|nr:homeobox protein CDX-1 [Callorhinus ursinus]XP_027461826.1 homeobox protein CDX-1 [Zalophus californianus]XP_027962292.1 homeobox protein CDX-1 [Eumetopias jubatus]
MYVGYVLDKDSPVYPGPARPASLGLGPQAYGPPPAPPGPPQYPDFTSYSHVEPAPAPSAAWSAPFSAPKDDWAAAYGPGPTAPAASPAPLAFGPPPDFSPVPAPPGPGPSLLAQPLGGPGAPCSPGAQRRTPYEWMRRSVAAGGGGGSGKTRTKDKYRVVYTDHQRLELEKEFHYSRYITIRRKSELAANLGLTERQVKIWFQNRRAKERKVNKKKQQQPPPPPPPAHEVTPTAAGPPLGGLCPSSASLLGASSPMPVKEEYLP